MKIIAVIATAIIFSLSAYGQTTQKFTATKASEYGLVYNLPITAFDITIEAEKTVKRPGEYFKYAKKYLDVDNPISETSQSWKVKSITITSRGIADPNELYLMQFKKGTSPFIIVNEENMPLAINTDKVSDVEVAELPRSSTPLPTPLETNAAQQVISQEMLQSQSSAKRAEIAAQQIYALRQSRTDLITGQAEQMPPDGQAMQLVLDNISAQEAALTAMFIGTTQQSTEVKTFTIVPDTVSTNQIIARLSVIDGIVSDDDLSGDPIYVSIDIVEKGELPINEKTGLAKQFPKGGVAYRIPGKATVEVEYNGSVITSQNFEVAQVGIVFGLDPAMFTDKKAPAYLIFEPTTGGIKELGAVTP